MVILIFYFAFTTMLWSPRIILLSIRFISSPLSPDKSMFEKGRVSLLLL